MTREEYNTQHKYCPSCNSARVETTTKGVLFITVDKKDLKKDDNRAKCLNCAWLGIVDDLV